jgi:hypothetical protein
MKSRIVLAAMLICLAASPLRADPKLQLWFYYPTNLLVDKNIDQLDKIWRQAAAAGYDHVLLSDSKFSRLGTLDEHYFANVDRVKKIADELKLQITPCLFDIGYSNSLLFNNPNLAEGLPVKDALFVVHDGKAQVVADPAVELGKMGWKDDVVKVDGGVATVRDNPGNARMVWSLNLPQFRLYHVSVWIRTENYSGEPKIAALAAGDRNLQYQNLAVKRTQDWAKYDVVFNTLDHDQVNLYLGVWGGAEGTLQWKDWKIEEAGLVNVLRRPGTPVVVKGYVEGRDYEPIVDPNLGNHPWKGEYEAWHDEPAIITHLPEGTRLRVSWYSPAIIYDEQMPICFTEPETRRLLADQARRMKSAFGAAGYMMEHDEIRVQGWDESAAQTHEDAGAMLADNARYCLSLLAGSQAYVWSDMFDPFHNAHKDYFLVKGDLSGSWEGLNRSVVIVNWNFEHRDQSLKFFADRGNRQIIAGYYDGDVKQIHQWLASAAKVQGVIGVMYTTWRNDYDDLGAFARETGRIEPLGH